MSGVWPNHRGFSCLPSSGRPRWLTCPGVCLRMHHAASFVLARLCRPLLSPIFSIRHGAIRAVGYCVAARADQSQVGNLGLLGSVAGAVGTNLFLGYVLTTRSRRTASPPLNSNVEAVEKALFANG
jgi:hypothetical protein